MRSRPARIRSSYPRRNPATEVVMPKTVSQPIYRDLKRSIENGSYAYGTFLPSEAELTKHYDCSRSSVRRALAMLATDGLVQPQQGKGVRVIVDPGAPEAVGYKGLETFNEVAARYGFTPGTKVLTFEEVEADADLAKLTGFSEGSKLTHIMRARSANGMTISTDESFYLSDEVPGLTPEIVENSVYAYLEGTLGMKIGTSRRSITIEAATDADREIIDLGGFNALGVMRSNTFNADGELMEYTESRQRPGIFSYYEVAIRPQH